MQLHLHVKVFMPVMVSLNVLYLPYYSQSLGLTSYCIPYRKSLLTHINVQVP